MSKITEISKKEAMKQIRSKIGSTNWEKGRRHTNYYKENEAKEIKELQEKIRTRFMNVLPRFIINEQLDEMGFNR